MNGGRVMGLTVGIPRALFYYQHAPFWSTFFEGLGLETVESPHTNKEILDLGSARAVDGCCLPLKVFLGHVLHLADRGIDTIFVPKIVSIVRREYICPYFLGLPDFARHYLPNHVRILDPVVDKRRWSWQWARSFVRFGSDLASFRQAVRAFSKAQQRQRDWEAKQLIEGHELPKNAVLLLGHRYLIEDRFFSGSIFDSFSKSGFHLVMAHQLPEPVLRMYARRLQKRMFWTSGRQSLGAMEYVADHIVGVVTLASFACGTDSLVSDLIQRRARNAGVPNIVLHLDEHTGAAGTITRLEAFIDMLQRRRTS